jgi:hypothetical protein
MIEESLATTITRELESKKADPSVVPTHWEIGIERLKSCFMTGLVRRIDPGSFLLVDLPVKISLDKPDVLNLVTEKINA